jgi:hypothetical protein
MILGLIGFLFGIVLITFYLGNKIYFNYAKSPFVTIPYNCFDAFTSKALDTANLYRQKHKVNQFRLANLTVFDLAYGYTCDVVIGFNLQPEDESLITGFLGENIFLFINSTFFSFAEASCQSKNLTQFNLNTIFDI